HLQLHLNHVDNTQKRNLQKSLLALITRDVPNRSPFRYPMGLVARSSPTRAVRETLLWQKIVAVNSCEQAYPGPPQARVCLNGTSVACALYRFPGCNSGILPDASRRLPASQPCGQDARSTEQPRWLCYAFIRLS